MRELTALLADWAARDDLRALVLTGRGRSFCAGAALGDVAGADWSDNPLTRLCDALEAFPAPTVAGLNGGAYGGGVELALACDFRVGVTGMRAFAPPARLGIHYEPAGIRRAIDRLGSQAARRLFLLAETFDAEALLALGFLDHLVAPDALEAKVADHAEGLAAQRERRELRFTGRRARSPCKASDRASANSEVNLSNIKCIHVVSRALQARHSAVSHITPRAAARPAPAARCGRSSPATRSPRAPACRRGRGPARRR